MIIRSTPRLVAAGTISIAIVLAPLTAFGDDDDAREHYRAQQALQSGKIRPLEDIIATVRKEVPGDIIEIEFETEDGRYIYEMEIIQPSGQIIEIEIDATTKVILGREES